MRDFVVRFSYGSTGMAICTLCAEGRLYSHLELVMIKRVCAFRAHRTVLPGLEGSLEL